jgi:hypothetical protein
MKNAHSKAHELSALRPVGMALAAVVAGLGSAQASAAPATHAHAPLEPTSQANTYVVDPTNHPGFEEDSSFVVGASEPMAPFSAPAAAKTRRDLFD